MRSSIRCFDLRQCWILALLLWLQCRTASSFSSGTRLLGRSGLHLCGMMETEDVWGEAPLRGSQGDKDSNFVPDCKCSVLMSERDLVCLKAQ